MASKWVRFAARAIDAAIELILVIAVWFVAGDAHKLITDLFLAAAAITAYEGLSCAWFAGTPAMRLLGLRVVELDAAGRPSAGVCVRRGAMVGVLTVIPIIGWGLWLVSMFGDALGRAFPDRVSGSMVVPDRFDGAVAAETRLGTLSLERDEDVAANIALSLKVSGVNATTEVMNIENALGQLQYRSLSAQQNKTEDNIEYRSTLVRSAQ